MNEPLAPLNPAPSREALHAVQLPREILDQFGQLRSRLFRLETATWLSAAFLSVSVAFLLLFLSDRLWDSPRALRLLLALLAFGAAASCAFFWLLRWVIRPRTIRGLSMLVQKRFRRLGDRLLGIVELTEEETRPAHFSPALYRAAIQQVAADAAPYSFPEAADPRPAKRFLAAALCAALLVILPFLLVPEAGWNGLLRFALPLSKVPRLTLVELENLPAQRVVAHGEPFDLEASLRYRSFWRPRTVRVQLDSKSEAPVHDGRFQVTLPGQTAKIPLRLRAGDDAKTVLLIPAHRPALMELRADIELPEYLRLPPRAVSALDGSLQILEGSRLTLHARANRSLSLATVSASDPIEPLKPAGDSFATRPKVITAPQDLVFSWTDTLGLTNAAPWRLSIQTHQDQAPRPEFLDLLTGASILETEVLEIQAAAYDDYGIQELGMLWRRADDPASTNLSGSDSFKFRTSGTSEPKTEVRTAFFFSPQLLQIPPNSTVELLAYATDLLPGRDPSVTPLFRLHVLGNTQHAEMVRRELEALLSRVEEVTRLEENIAAATRQLAELDEEALRNPERRQEMENAEMAQSENARQLENIATEGMRAILEGLRNPVFSPELLAEWSKMLQEMQQLAQSAMPQAAQSLQQAQASQAAQNLAEALEQEQSILDALAQMQQNVNQGLDDLQALTLAQRLRELSTSHKAVEQQLQQIMPQVIGLLPQELSLHFSALNTALAVEEEDLTAEASQLHGEISRYHERTKTAAYGQVATEMEEAKMEDQLLQTRELIQANISMRAIQSLADWSSHFNTWADLLQPPKSAGGESGGGGEGGGEGGPDLMQHLMALLRIRERQLTVREQTRLLEQEKWDAPRYQAGTETVASSQKALHSDLEPLAEKSPFPALAEPLSDAGTQMNDAMALLEKPQTDDQTLQTQTGAIQNLSDAINILNEQAQQSSSSSQGLSAQQMAFMMQMLALQPGAGQGQNPSQSGGGGTSGGSTERPSDPLSGAASGTSAAGRGVQKGSGAPASVPAEFREALDNYFKAIETQLP